MQTINYQVDKIYLTQSEIDKLQTKIIENSFKGADKALVIIK